MGGDDSGCGRSLETGQEECLHSLRELRSVKLLPGCQCSLARVVCTINPYLWRWQMCWWSLTIRLNCIACLSCSPTPLFTLHFSTISEQDQLCGDGHWGHAMWLWESQGHKRVTSKPTAFQKCLLLPSSSTEGSQGSRHTLKWQAGGREEQCIRNYRLCPPNWKPRELVCKDSHLEAFTKPTESVLHVQGGPWGPTFSQAEAGRDLHLFYISMSTHYLRLALHFLKFVKNLSTSLCFLEKPLPCSLSGCRTELPSSGYTVGQIGLPAWITHDRPNI